MEAKSALNGARTVTPNIVSTSFFNHHSFPQEGKSKSPPRNSWDQTGNTVPALEQLGFAQLSHSSLFPHSFESSKCSPEEVFAECNAPAQLCLGRNLRQRQVPFCSQLLITAFLFHPIQQLPLPQICQRSYVQEHPLACIAQNNHTSLTTINTWTFRAWLIFDRTKLGLSVPGS